MRQAALTPSLFDFDEDLVVEVKPVAPEPVAEIPIEVPPADPVVEVPAMPVPAGTLVDYFGQPCPVQWSKLLGDGRIHASIRIEGSTFEHTDLELVGGAWVRKAAVSIPNPVLTEASTAPADLQIHAWHCRRRPVDPRDPVSVAVYDRDAAWLAYVADMTPERGQAFARAQWALDVAVAA